MNKVTNVAPSKPLIKKKITSRGDHSTKKQIQIHKDYIKKGKDLSKLKAYLKEKENKKLKKRVDSRKIKSKITSKVRQTAEGGKAPKKDPCPRMSSRKETEKLGHSLHRSRKRQLQLTEGTAVSQVPMLYERFTITKRALNCCAESFVSIG